MTRLCLACLLAIALSGRHVGIALRPHAELVRRREGAPANRLVLIKMDRAGSSLLFSQLKRAICDRKSKCSAQFHSENLNDIGKTYHDYTPEARQEIMHRFESQLSCNPPNITSCGFSLNLQKEKQFGFMNINSDAIRDLIDVLIARDVHVIFLTRLNCFEQSLSSCVGTERQLIIDKSIDFRNTPGGPCDAWHLYKCSSEQQEYIRSRKVSVDQEVLTQRMRLCKDVRHLYLDLRQKLNENNIDGRLSISHVEFEQLTREQTWRSLYSTFNVTGEVPSMIPSKGEYRATIENYQNLRPLASLMGYEFW